MKTSAQSATGTPKAYRYGRVSSLKQVADGMGLDRQQSAAEAWAAQHHMVIDDRYSAEDTGVSGSSGKNLKQALGRILAAAKAGDIKRGDYLVIESTSRLTRLVPRLARKIVEELVSKDVRVIFVDSGMQYDQDTIDQIGHDMAFSALASANSEYSKNLSRYGIKTWERKREEIKQGIPSTRMLPFWLHSELIVDARGRHGRGPIKLNKPYAKIVEKIFREYLAGDGKARIAKRLSDEIKFNAAGELISGTLPPLRVGSDKRADRWHAETVGRTLANPSVTGVFQSHKEIKPIKTWSLEELLAALIRDREPIDPPVPDYFPRVISDEVFAAAAAKRDSNRARAGSRIGGHTREVAHILARLAVCPVCHGSMTRVSKTNGTVPRYLCAKVGSGKAGSCVRHYVVVADVEKALVASADALGALTPTPDSAVTSELAALSERHATLHAQVTQLSETVEGLIDRVEPVPSVMSAKLAKLESERDALSGELEKLRGKATAAQPNVVKQKVAAMVAALKGYGPGPLDLNAAHVNAAMCEVFERVIIDYRARDLICHYKIGPPPATVKY